MAVSGVVHHVHRSRAAHSRKAGVHFAPLVAEKGTVALQQETRGRREQRTRQPALRQSPCTSVTNLLQVGDVGGHLVPVDSIQRIA
jgi:hypothetical protein